MRAFGNTTYVRDPTKHPPLAGYILGGLGVLAGIVVIGWQMFTTGVAFYKMIVDGSAWRALPLQAQVAAATPVLLICILVAVSFSFGLLFFVFKVDKRWATERHQMLSKAARVKVLWQSIADVASDNVLLTGWAIISFVGDTIGDAGFMNIYSHDTMVLFFYCSAIYSLSTISLSESLQVMWDAVISSEWLKHIRLMNARDEEALRKSAKA